MEEHPIWPIIRIAVVMISVTILLWASASNFDKTEIRVILALIPVLAGTEGVKKLLGK